MAVYRDQWRRITAALAEVDDPAAVQGAILFEMDRSLPDMREAFADFYTATFEDFAEAEYRKVAKLAGKQLLPRLRAMLDLVLSYAGNQVTLVMGTDKARVERMLRSILPKLVQEGMEIDRLDRGPSIIKKLMPELRKVHPAYGARYAVERVARTEVIRVSNQASWQGANAASEDHNLTIKKRWLATRDGRTRDDHAGADGQIAEMNEAFDVGGEQLQYPGDPAGSAANVINCRCAIEYIEDK